MTRKDVLIIEEPELFRELDEDDLLSIADAVEEVITSKYGDPKRLRHYRSIYRQAVLYRKFMRLLNEELGIFEIARFLGIEKSTIYFWFKKGTSPFTSYKIPPPTYDLGYLLGSGIGDGSADPKGRSTQYAWLKDEDFADAIVKSAERLGIPAWKWRKRGWQVAYSNVVVTELIKVGKVQPLRLLPVLTINKEIARGALTGWFDAEGSPGSFNLNSYKYDAPRGASANQDIVRLMAYLLDLLGIHHTIGGFKNAKEFISPQTGKIYKPKSGKTYTVRIRRCCIIRFSKLVGFRIRRKQEQLHMLIAASKFKKIC